MSLVKSILDNDPDTVKHLISQGANVDLDPIYGGTATPLMYAASKGRLECGKALIDANANIDKTFINGQTAIHGASANGHVEIVKILIQHKGNVNVLDQHGRLALHYACSNGNLACVKILVAGGSYIDILNTYHQTPLSNAITNHQCEIAQFLLYSGAKMSNVAPNIEIPDWMIRIVMKRKWTIHSTLTLKGVLRKRFKVDGAEAAFLNGGIPKDMVNLVGYHVLSTWLDPKWG